MPARKPRTECCCHAVAFTMASMVVPAGLCSIARTFACLLPGRAELEAFNPADFADFDGVGRGRFAPCLVVTRCFVPALRTVRLAAGFDFDVAIGISIGCGENISPTTAAPQRPNGGAGISAVPASLNRNALQTFGDHSQARGRASWTCRIGGSNPSDIRHPT